MSNSQKSLGAVVVVLLMILCAIAVPLADMPAAAGAERISNAGGWPGPGRWAGEGGEGGASERAGASIIYAILCPAMFKDTLKPLKDWKTKKGMNAEIYTLESMLAAYSGPEVPDFAKVHKYLRGLYSANPQLRWVLIVGDGDQDSPAASWYFPVPYIFTNASLDPDMGDRYTILDYVPSDVMYSGLERDWYMNYSDIYNYGLTRNEDWTPEVYVGRWPCKTLAEAEGNVNKVLTYEKPPPYLVGDWMRSALFAGSLYDIPNIVDPNPDNWTNNAYQWTHDNGRTPILDSADQFPASISKKLLFDYDQTYGGNYNPASDTLSQAAFVAEMNSGYSLVTTASHAWVSGNGPTNYIGNGSDPDLETWKKFQEFYFWTDAQAASNGMRLPLMYSSACDIANFTTFSYPYSNIPDNRDRSLEQLLKNPNGGAIGFISATNGDWWNTSDANWWLEVNFWKEFFNGSFRPGEALYKDKVAYDNYFKSRKMNNDIPKIRQNKAIYILLGDPEVPIWTDIPGNLKIEAPSQLTTARQTVNVTVRDFISDRPVKNALVAFTAPDGTFARGWTDANGTTGIVVEANSAGQVSLTVTAHNYLPLEQEVTAVLAPPDLTLGNPDLSMVSEGAVVRAGETVTISAIVHNTGGLTAESAQLNFYDGNPAAGGNLRGSTTIPTIPAHLNQTAQFGWTAAAGPNAVYVWVDPNNQINEISEANNIAFIEFTSSAVDLTLSTADISLAPSILKGGLPTAPSGSTLNLTAMVHNLGTGTVEDAYVRFYDGDPRTGGAVIGGDKRLGSIGAGGTASASVTWNNTNTGLHMLLVVVDPMGFVSEFNESNNGAGLEVRLDETPYFTMEIPPVSTDEERNLVSFLDLSQYVADADDLISELDFRIVSQAPPGANVSVSPEGLISIYPLTDWNGQAVVTVGASDGVSEGYAKFNVTVRPVPDPPVIDPVPEANLTVGQYFAYNVTARDPDPDDDLQFNADTTLFDINSTSGRITYVPQVTHLGKHSVKITVTDSDGLSSFTTWKFAVTRPNQPPRLLIGNDLVIPAREGQPLLYKFNVTDPDGDALTFSVDTLLFTISPDGEINFTPPSGSAGTYSFNVTVRDAGGLSDTRQVMMIIKEAIVVEQPPQEGPPMWLFLLLLVVIVIACAASTGILLSRRKVHRVDEDMEKARYESLYGAGTYEYAKKVRSTSLREFRAKERAPTMEEEAREFQGERKQHEAAGQKCPKCGSVKVQVFPDGGAICNNCGKMFNV